jgi:DNA-binding transcriptional regulator YiaG
MIHDEVKNIRQKFELTREEFAQFLCISNLKAMSNIEIGFRNPNRFALKFLRYLDSLPKKKAMTLIQEIKEFKE